MRKFTPLLLASLFQLIVIISPGARSETPLLGDVGDGSRAVPVHRIPLLDEEGAAVLPGDGPAVPFSTRKTCSNNCHSYETIATGWHFNAIDSKAHAGRPGHPWIYWDKTTGMVIPLSYRNWPGSHKSNEFGITSWKFIQFFGRHLPGGGVGETDCAVPEETIRSYVSGKLEINCLACHDADPAHDQAEYATQIMHQNYRWAAASTSSFAFVSGSAKDMPDTFDYLMPDGLNDSKLVPPSIKYDSNRFDPNNKVFFNIARNVPNGRCYYCHSTQIVDSPLPEEMLSSKDVHLAAGLNCVDCHRHGLDHKMTRGFDDNMMTAEIRQDPYLTCKGCHLSIGLFRGRYDAPRPEHRGIPPVHFDKLTCTACHSGPWPTYVTQRVKTSLAHGLGTHNVNKAGDASPLIHSPVFVRQADGKIAPHHLIWPSFWGTLAGSTVSAFPIEAVESVMKKSDETESMNSLDDPTRYIIQTLDSFSKLKTQQDGQIVYVSSGKLNYQSENGIIKSIEHDAAKPYTWAFAHDVRPAAQSLGISGCQDCHTLNSSFFFGLVKNDSAIPQNRNSVKRMQKFQGLDSTYLTLLAFSFLFRTPFKVFLILCCMPIIVILTGWKIPMVPSQSKWLTLLNRSLYLFAIPSFITLVITGLFPWLIGSTMTGYPLLIHVTCAGLFTLCLTVLTVIWSSRSRFEFADWNRFLAIIREDDFPEGTSRVSLMNLGHKICYWAIVVLALPLIVSIVLCMFPLLGTEGQILAVQIHRVCALFFSIFAMIHLYLLLLVYAGRK